MPAEADKASVDRIRDTRAFCQTRKTTYTREARPGPSMGSFLQKWTPRVPKIMTRPTVACATGINDRIR
jgi:hypothetical protein